MAATRVVPIERTLCSSRYAFSRHPNKLGLCVFECTRTVTALLDLDAQMSREGFHSWALWSLIDTVLARSETFSHIFFRRDISIVPGASESIVSFFLGEMGLNMKRAIVWCEQKRMKYITSPRNDGSLPRRPLLTVQQPSRLLVSLCLEVLDKKTTSLTP